jgi:hypothetical protein
MKVTLDIQTIITLAIIQAVATVLAGYFLKWIQQGHDIANKLGKKIDEVTSTEKQ